MKASPEAIGEFYEHPPLKIKKKKLKHPYLEDEKSCISASEIQNLTLQSPSILAVWLLTKKSYWMP